MKNKSNLWIIPALAAGGFFWATASPGRADLATRVKSWWPGADASGKKTEPVVVEGPVLNLQDSFAKVAALVKPAVVSITSTHVETVQAQPEFYFGDPFEEFFRQFQGAPPRPAPQPRSYQRRQTGLGSGVVVDPRGYILTNEHVVRGADELTVTFQLPQEKKYSAKVVGADPRTDLAVVKISPKEPLTYASLGDSEKIRVGDWAIAIGSPFGLEQTLTVGVISAVRQSLNIEGVNYSNLLQTDAAINRGNSGGPLLNIRGEVIGINSAIYAPTGVFAGIGFAIPVNRVKDIMSQLIEKGRVVRGWMGVEVLSLNEVLAKQFRLANKDGVLVNNVVPGSPAAKAGLLRGDVILSFAGAKTPNPEALADAVSKTAPKTTVKISIVRDGRPLDISLTAGEMPQSTDRENANAPEAQSAPEEEGPASWEGAKISGLSPDLARRLNLPARTAGVVVLSVEPGGLGEKLNLEEGDVIGSVNRVKTPDVGAFQKAVKTINPKDGFLLDIFRGGRWLYLSYREGQ